MSYDSPMLKIIPVPFIYRSSGVIKPANLILLKLTKNLTSSKFSEREKVDSLNSLFLLALSNRRAGLAILFQTTQSEKSNIFVDWAKNPRVPDAVIVKLSSMLINSEFRAPFLEGTTESRSIFSVIKESRPHLDLQKLVISRRRERFNSI